VLGPETCTGVFGNRFLAWMFVRSGMQRKAIHRHIQCQLCGCIPSSLGLRNFSHLIFVVQFVLLVHVGFQFSQIKYSCLCSGLWHHVMWCDTGTHILNVWVCFTLNFTGICNTDYFLYIICLGQQLIITAKHQQHFLFEIPGTHHVEGCYLVRANC
jgi:hypothetical protein